MAVHWARYLISALILFAIGGYIFTTYTQTASQQSTFNILPGNYEYFTVSRNSGDSISGSYQETAGTAVNYYIMSSTEFVSFQNGTAANSLYAIIGQPNGSFSYTFTGPGQDTYYFVFRHGAGLLNTTQTVNYQRTYQVHYIQQLVFGTIAIAIGAVDIAFAFRAKRKSDRAQPVFPPAGTPPAYPAPASTSVS
jgi:hypothetical protein